MRTDETHEPSPLQSLDGEILRSKAKPFYTPRYISTENHIFFEEVTVTFSAGNFIAERNNKIIFQGNEQEMAQYLENFYWWNRPAQAELYKKLLVRQAQQATNKPF